MNDISTRNNPTKKIGLWTIGLLAIAGILTTAGESQACGPVYICPWAPEGGPNPVIATLDNPAADCWTGSSWDTGISWSMGSITTTSGSGRSVAAYCFWNLEHNPPRGYGPGWAVSDAFDSNNTYKCSTYDYSGNGAWEYNTSSACNNASYVIVYALAPWVC